MTVKANVWLDQQGFLPNGITRGRRSTENTARLESAYRQGMRFSDWEPKESTNAKGEVVIKNAVKSVTGPKVISDIHYSYPEDSFVAYAVVNEKKIPVGMRECCSTCRVSLVGHLCDMPRVTTVKGHIGKQINVSIVPK